MHPFPPFPFPTSSWGVRNMANFGVRLVPYAKQSVAGGRLEEGGPPRVAEPPDASDRCSGKAATIKLLLHLENLPPPPDW